MLKCFDMTLFVDIRCDLGSMAWALSIGRGLETPDVPSCQTSADRTPAKEWRQRYVA
jgi:hypothetical protein